MKAHGSCRISIHRLSTCRRLPSWWNGISNNYKVEKAWANEYTVQLLLSLRYLRKLKLDSNIIKMWKHQKFDVLASESKPTEDVWIEKTRWKPAERIRPVPPRDIQEGSGELPEKSRSRHQLQLLHRDLHCHREVQPALRLQSIMQAIRAVQLVIDTEGQVLWNFVKAKPINILKISISIHFLYIF